MDAQMSVPATDRTGLSGMRHPAGAVCPAARRLERGAGLQSFCTDLAALSRAGHPYHTPHARRTQCTALRTTPSHGTPLSAADRRLVDSAQYAAMAIAPVRDTQTANGNTADTKKTAPQTPSPDRSKPACVPRPPLPDFGCALTTPARQNAGKLAFALAFSYFGSSLDTSSRHNQTSFASALDFS